MISECVIDIQNVSKVYKLYEKPIFRIKESLHPFGRKFHKDFYALDNVSFKVKRGETIGVVGRNGSGKSTLLKIITGVLTSTNGKVVVNGRVSSLLELGAGFNPDYTGLENIYLQAMLHGIKKDEMKFRLDQIISFADIGEYLFQTVRTYSSGMFARLAFSIAINVDPDILIVDEALSVGDIAFQKKCFSKMEDLRTKGVTILFVSHSEKQILELCDRALLLHSGLLIYDNSPKEVVTAYSKIMNNPHIDFREIIKQDDVNTSPVKEEFYNENKNNVMSDWFDPGLVSTPVYYPENGAKIISVKIYNIQEKEVNVILSRNDYIIHVECEFYSDLKKIHFGVHIRTITGVEITGQRYPANWSYIDSFKNGSKVIVKFKFSLFLMPEYYFIGAGIWSNEGNSFCIHRILDARMLRVEDSEIDYSFGYCDLSAKLPEIIVY